MECLICKKEVKNYIALGLHLKKYHDNMTSKEYYDKYLRQSNEGICPVCGKETKFQGIRLGYLKHCSIKCNMNDENTTLKREQTCIEKFGVPNPYQSEEIKEKIKQKMIEKTGYEYNLQRPETIEKSKQTKLQKYGDRNYNNVQKAKETNQQKYGVDSYSKTQEFKDFIRENNDFDNIHQKGLETHNINIEKQKSLGYMTLQELFSIYGQSWYKNNLVPILYKYHCGFVSLEDVDKIDKYYNSNNGHSSQQEQKLYDIIKKYYNGKVIRGDRTVLNSYELDFYLPDKNLAFEYNGIYWHSTKHKEKDYHYNKSIECFNKGIRLVHIYEFESWEDIEEFISSIFNNTEKLTNNFDKFSPLQFSYNNIQFSKEQIIYKDDYDFIIYGSGTFTLL